MIHGDALTEEGVNIEFGHMKERSAFGSDNSPTRKALKTSRKTQSMSSLISDLVNVSSACEIAFPKNTTNRESRSNEMLRILSKQRGTKRLTKTKRIADEASACSSQKGAADGPLIQGPLISFYDADSGGVKRGVGSAVPPGRRGRDSGARMREIGKGTWWRRLFARSTRIISPPNRTMVKQSLSA